MYEPSLEMLARLGKDFTYHAPFGDQPARYAMIRALGLELAEKLVHLTPPSREQSTALTNLDQVVFWANAAIARNEGAPGVA